MAKKRLMICRNAYRCPAKECNHYRKHEEYEWCHFGACGHCIPYHPKKPRIVEIKRGQK